MILQELNLDTSPFLTHYHPENFFFSDFVQISYKCVQRACKKFGCDAFLNYCSWVEIINNFVRSIYRPVTGKGKSIQDLGNLRKCKMKPYLSAILNVYTYMQCLYILIYIVLYVYAKISTNIYEYKLVEQSRVKGKVMGSNLITDHFSKFLLKTSSPPPTLLNLHCWRKHKNSVCMAILFKNCINLKLYIRYIYILLKSLENIYKVNSTFVHCGIMSWHLYWYWFMLSIYNKSRIWVYILYLKLNLYLG